MFFRDLERWEFSVSKTNIFSMRPSLWSEAYIYGGGGIYKLVSSALLWEGWCGMHMGSEAVWKHRCSSSRSVSSCVTLPASHQIWIASRRSVGLASGLASLQTLYPRFIPHCRHLLANTCSTVVGAAPTMSSFSKCEQSMKLDSCRKVSSLISRNLPSLYLNWAESFVSSYYSLSWSRNL